MISMSRSRASLARWSRTPLPAVRRRFEKILRTEFRVINPVSRIFDGGASRSGAYGQRYRGGQRHPGRESHHAQQRHTFAPRVALGNTPTLFGKLSTVDHKTIGLRYLVTAFAFLAAGGVEALVMRVQLSRSGMHTLSPEAMTSSSACMASP
jgi:hypothetical protein